MRTIYFKGSRPKGHPFPIISWLIRLFEWSKISHNYVDLNSGDTPQIFHAHFNDIEFKAKEEYEPKVHLLYTFPVKVTEEQYQEIEAYCKGLEGRKKGYFTQMFGIALIAPFRWFGKHLKNPLCGYSSMMCSEICRHIGINILGFEEIENAPHPEAYYTTDFIKLMQKNLKISGQE
jgi:hypothetical protein